MRQPDQGTLPYSSLDERLLLIARLFCKANLACLHDKFLRALKNNAVELMACRQMSQGPIQQERHSKSDLNTQRQSSL